MAQKIKLPAALRVWNEANTMHSEAHLTMSQLQLLAAGNADEARWEMLAHITTCEDCSVWLRLLLSQDNVEIPYRDSVQLMAAAGAEKSWPQQIISDNKVYEINILQNELEREKGFISVKIIDPAYQEKLEGQKIVVTDGNQQVLLASEIQQNQAFQPIENLNMINLTGELTIKISTIDE